MNTAPAVHLTPVHIHRNEKLMHAMNKLGASCSIMIHTDMLVGVFDRMTGGRYKLDKDTYGNETYYTAKLSKNGGRSQIVYFLKDDGDER